MPPAFRGEYAIKKLAILAAGIALFIGAGFAPVRAEEMKHHAPAAKAEGKVATENRADVLYTCACGADCKCNSAATKPGKCKCGKPMAWGHVVKIDGNDAYLCTCAEGCQCKGLDPKDPAKCACGKPIKKVSLKGTGVFFCNCGGSCECNTVSDKPGKCKCGMDLKKVD